MSVKLRRRKLPSGKVQMFLDIYQGGSRRFESLGMFLNGDRLHNRELVRLAEGIRAKRELDIQSEYYGVATRQYRRESFIEYFVKVMGEKPSMKTRRIYGDALKHLTKFNGGKVLFGELSRGFFERFKMYLLDRVSANTSHLYFSRVGAVVRQAVRENMIPVNGASGIRIKTTEGLPKFLTLDEVKKLAETVCDYEQVKAGFLFSCFTGLRYSDVDQLSWDQIRDGYVEFTQVKTGNKERIPLGAEAKRILEGQNGAKPDDRLKKEYKDGVVFFMPDDSVVNVVLKRWGKQAEIGKSISFHYGRHTFATLSLSAGIDIYTTSKLLGHRNVTTTQIYARVVDERKEKAVAMLPTL